MTAKEDLELSEGINWKQTIWLEFYFGCQKECHHWRIVGLKNNYFFFCNQIQFFLGGFLPPFILHDETCVFI